MLDNVNWEEYYQAIQGSQPRSLLLSALELFKSDPPRANRLAIDLGCGDGTESFYLLENSWQVLAIDVEATAINYLLAKTPDHLADNLQTQIARFENSHLPPADLIHANLTLPFCEPAQYGSLWQKIVASIVVNGRFAGHFFGVNDSWAVNTDMTIHTEAEVRALFPAFAIEFFHEKDEDGQATNGPKHWHIFTVIARKS